MPMPSTNSMAPAKKRVIVLALIGTATVSYTHLDVYKRQVQDVTYDLHRSEWEAGNIHTEYEETFSAKGFAINRAVAVLQS